LLALAAWANDLALGLDLEVKRTSGGGFWSWAGLRVVVAAIAKIEWVTADFEAKLVITVLGRRRALETSEILILELVGLFISS